MLDKQQGRPWLPSPAQAITNQKLDSGSTFYPSTQEAEAGESEFKAYLGYKVSSCPARATQ